MGPRCCAIPLTGGTLDTPQMKWVQRPYNWKATSRQPLREHKAWTAAHNTERLAPTGSSFVLGNTNQGKAATPTGGLIPTDLRLRPSSAAQLTAGTTLDPLRIVVKTYCRAAHSRRMISGGITGSLRWFRRLCCVGLGRKRCIHACGPLPRALGWKGASFGWKVGADVSGRGWFLLWGVVLKVTPAEEAAKIGGQLACDIYKVYLNCCGCCCC